MASRPQWHRGIASMIRVFVPFSNWLIGQPAGGLARPRWWPTIGWWPRHQKPRGGPPRQLIVTYKLTREGAPSRLLLVGCGFSSRSRSTVTRETSKRLHEIPFSHQTASPGLADRAPLEDLHSRLCIPRTRKAPLELGGSTRLQPGETRLGTQRALALVASNRMLPQTAIRIPRHHG